MTVNILYLPKICNKSNFLKESTKLFHQTIEKYQRAWTEVEEVLD